MVECQYDLRGPISRTILVLGTKYALVHKALPRPWSLFLPPQTLCYRNKSSKKLLLVYVAFSVLKDSQKNMGPIFADPKNNWNKPTTSQHFFSAAPSSRWRLPTTSLGKNGELFGHHISTSGRMYIFFLHIIYIITLYICICTILIIR